MSCRCTTLLVVMLAGAARPALAESQSRADGDPCRLPHSTPSGVLVLPATAPFKATLHDFRHLPSWRNAAALGIGAGAAFAAHQDDAGLSRSLAGSRPLDVMRPGSIIGSVPVQLGAAVATYAIGRSLERPCAATVGADLIRAQLLSQALTMGMKVSFRSSRPDGTSNGFPSGHTSISFASATVLQRHFGWKVGVPAFAVASYVAASRVQMKRHHVSDVAFGAAIGIVAGRTVRLGHAWTIAPLATGGGAGVAMTWTGR